MTLMIKRILIMVLVLIVFMTQISLAAFNDVDINSKYGKAIDYLVSANILSGYNQYEFGSKDPLTRAQFAKIVVLMAGREKEALTKTTESFTDVGSDHWAVGYINEAASLGLITGYPDGSFGADEKITYAQAITVIIRTLGYSPSEVGTNWPNDYINKARELLITDGLTFQRNDILTREVAAYMLYNSLYAKNGSGNVSSGLKKVDGVIIYGVNSLNSVIGIEDVLTSGGTFKKGKGYTDDYLGKKVNIKVNSENEIIMIAESEDSYRELTLLSTSENKIATNEEGTLEIESNLTVYYKGNKSAYKDIYGVLNQGSKILLYDDCMYVEENKLKGPFIITKDYTEIYEFLGDISGATLTIDGENAKITEVEKYDVIYYNDAAKKIYVYNERETGIYEKALPSKNNLSGIVVSGTTYSALSITAKAKLGDSENSFKISDRITLLFGKDGEVVDVVDINGRTLGDFGVLLNAYSEESKDKETLGKKEYFVNLMLGSGKTVTYKTDKDYSDTDNTTYTGKVVYITVLAGGIVSLKVAPKNIVTGELDKSEPSLDGHEFQQNYSILELIYSEKYDEAIVRKISLRDINLKSLSSEDVIHVEYANDFGDIAFIYVNDLTYDSYTFGVLNKAVMDEEANYTYELKSSSGTVTYRGSAGWSFVKGEVVMAMIKDGKIKTIKPLNLLTRTSALENYTETKIKIDNKTYEMDENLSVIYKNSGDGNWNVTTLKDLEENIKSGIWKINVIQIYTDNREHGKIRVIRVDLK